MINIEYQGLTIDQLKKRYDPAIIEKALARTKNRVADKSATALNKKVRERFVVKARDITGSLKKRRAFANKSSDAVLEYIGSRLPLSLFSPKQKQVRVVSKRTGKNIRRKGVTVKVLRTEPRKLITSIPAFLTKGGKAVSSRSDETRESYKTPTVISIPEMIRAREQLAEFEKVVAREIQPEFESNMNFYLGFK